MSRPIRQLAAFLTVGGWTLASRVLGFVRDILIAGFFGSSAIAEAFQVAISLPNMFRRFFAEGAFNTAFVPMFSKKYEAGEDPQGFARDAFTALASLLFVLTLVAQIFMPWLVYAMASGFADDNRFDLAVFMGRIAFPYILLISLSALLSGALNAMGRFAAAAAAPILLNIILVALMTAAYYLGGDVATALIWGVPIAGVAQLGLVWIAADKAGMRIRPRLPKWTPELKRLAIIAGPAALAGGVVQINLLVGRNVASYFDGAIQWLAVADRLYQLPLGVVGIAIGIVLLPDLSRRLRADDTVGGKQAFNRASEFALALTLPSAAALIVLAEPLVSVLFERGAYTAEDTAKTASAVAIYGLGLPAFVLAKIIQPLYFAREDTRTPFRFALIAMVLNAVLAIGLSYHIGYLAAAWGTTLSSWAMIALLWIGTKTMGDAATLDDRLRDRIPRLIAASVAMAAITYAAALVLDTALHTSGLRYVALLALVTIGAVSFACAAFLFKATSLRDLKSSLKR